MSRATDYAGLENLRLLTALTLLHAIFDNFDGQLPTVPPQLEQLGALQELVLGVSHVADQEVGGLESAVLGGTPISTHCVPLHPCVCLAQQ